MFIQTRPQVSTNNQGLFPIECTERKWRNEMILSPMFSLVLAMGSVEEDPLRIIFPVQDSKTRGMGGIKNMKSGNEE